MRHTRTMHDRDHRPVAVELDIRRDSVELRCPNYPISIGSRDYLSAWLANPYGGYVFDECSWFDTGPYITLQVGDTLTEQLTPAQLTALQIALRDAA